MNLLSSAISFSNKPRHSTKKGLQDLFTQVPFLEDQLDTIILWNETYF